MASANGGKEIDPQINNDDEESISMLDVLAEEKQLEDDADAVLGDSDDKNCTYQKGYATRQALYACLTCTPPSSRPGGLCLACSLECHEGHDLVELYTKRHFRCDCGNSRFPVISCKLNPAKQTNNVENKYNQNFRGLYCTCNRPYPDPEDDVEDEMIQCIICEDWYHGRHLGCDGPSSFDFQEMICDGCMKKHDFLNFYYVKSTEIPVSKSDTDGTVDVVNCNGASESGGDENKTKEATASDKQDSGKNSEYETKLTNGNCSQDVNSNANKSGKSKSETGKQSPAKRGQSSTSDQEFACLLNELQKREIQTQTGAATFWPDRWRDKLCRCVECMDMYLEKEIEFLTEESDTVKSYEERGKAKSSTRSQYEQGMNVLSHMDRMQQVEVLHEYNDLKSELKEYLKKFAENGKVVREEDIREFFTQMQGRKRQRVTTQMVYNCR